MARPKKPRANPESDAFFGLIGLSANQIVAYNLAHARSWRGWTQEQAAEAIEPYLGVLWSKASVSQAERSVDGNFVRNFSADEIVAFAQAFELPIGWFFMPPPPRDATGMPVFLVDREGYGPEPLATLIDMVFGTELQQADLVMRLDTWLQLASQETLTDAQHRVTDLVTQRVEALLRSSFRDLRQWQTSLHNIANHLERLEVRAKGAIAEDVGIQARELRATLGGLTVEAQRSESEPAADEQSPEPPRTGKRGSKRPPSATEATAKKGGPS